MIQFEYFSDAVETTNKKSIEQGGVLLKKVSHEFDEKVPCLSIYPGCLSRFRSRELVWDYACTNKACHRSLFKNWDCPISHTFFVVVNFGEISFLQQKNTKIQENPKNFCSYSEFRLTSWFGSVSHYLQHFIHANSGFLGDFWSIQRVSPVQNQPPSYAPRLRGSPIVEDEVKPHFGLDALEEWRPEDREDLNGKRWGDPLV